MNYFELYDIPLSFEPDLQVVKQKFYALSKKYHPDFYINESPEKQEEVLAYSTLNNKAFQVLSDTQQRLHYILHLKGKLEEGENYKLPQDFLMEMMEVNEVIMELEFDPDATKLAEVENQVEQIATTLALELNKLTYTFDITEEETKKDGLLNQIKAIYYRNKYLQRIKANLSKLSR